MSYNQLMRENRQWLVALVPLIALNRRKQLSQLVVMGSWQYIKIWKIIFVVLVVNAEKRQRHFLIWSNSLPLRVKCDFKHGLQIYIKHIPAPFLSGPLAPTPGLSEPVGSS